MNKVSYMGNGEITEFDFRFPFYENNNVVVLKNNKPATGYTIVKTPAGDGADVPYLGGRVVFQNAPLPMDSIVISRKLPLSRVVDYQPLAKIEPNLLNMDMNYLMESLKDFQDELDTFNEKYNGIVNTESVEVLLEKANFIEQLIQNKMLVTLDDFNSGITNCITEIPQDIKQELNNGTLTHKVGSKFYTPDGTDHTVSTSSSVSTASSNGQHFVYCAGNSGTLQSFSTTTLVSRAGSGSSLPADNTDYSVFLNTSNSKIYRYTGGDWSEWGVSFPLAIVTVSNGAISSIDQVFNGFGYIGGTIFTLPGVKGLVPNGRNADGTLNNANVFNATTVKINTPSDGEHDICLSRYSGYTDVPYVGTYIYDAEDNFVKRSSDGLDGGYVLAGKLIKTGGQITDFYVRPAFHAVDYSDTKFIAHQAMPSDRYINLNLGQSGAVYTAPADGFVCLRAKTTVEGKAYCITNEVNGMQNMVTVDGLGSEFAIFLPVSGGQVFSVKYEGALASGYVFRFVFLNAAK